MIQRNIPSVRPLTPREAQLAHGICREMSNKEIADELGLSLGVIKIYMHRLFRRLKVTTRTGVALRVMRSSGIVVDAECIRKLYF